MDIQPKLPNGCVLRQAQALDLGRIRWLVMKALLDPTQLHPSQFWVVESQGQIIACGQLRSFIGAQELGSLVVEKAWRGHGIGTYLVRHLIQQATQPLYLECLGYRLAQFYTKLGFVPVEVDELPQPLKKKFGLSFLATKILRLPLFILHVRSREP